MGRGPFGPDSVQAGRQLFALGEAEKESLSVREDDPLGRGLHRWTQALCESTAGKLVSINGKTVRGSFEGTSSEGALHLVNA